MSQRSTKGASKQRRDAINDRISQIRELLPASEAVRSRLSQLQVMAMTNAFITKSNFFADYCFDVDDRSTSLSDYFDFTQSLTGFLLIASIDGRILYISENVSEYLGNSAVDMLTQMESVYDIIDECDRDVLRQAMVLQQQQQQPLSSSLVSGESWLQDIHGGIANQHDSTANELTFTCRMNSAARCVRSAAAPTMSKTIYEKQKVMQVTGKFVKPRSLYYGARSPPLTTVFVAYCTPHLSTNGSAARASSAVVMETDDKDTMTYNSLHFLDMKYAQIDANGEHHLECNRGDVFRKSWYETIHPEDVDEAQRKHIELTSAYQIGDLATSKSLCIRVQTASGRFVWLHVVMSIPENGDHGDEFYDIVAEKKPMIRCVNHVIDETAALYLRVQDTEMQAAGAGDESYHRLMSTMVCNNPDAQSFSDFQFQGYNPIPMHSYVPFETTPCGVVDEKQELRQRLKRKIRDQQQEPRDNVHQSKTSKLDSAASGTIMSLCSMPSPPMQQVDHLMSSNGSFGQSQFHSSKFGNGLQVADRNSVNCDSTFDFQIESPPMNGFVTHQDGLQLIPDSFLTPSNSPALMESSPMTASEELYDLDDLFSRLPEEGSFFSATHSHQPLTTTTRHQEKPVVVAEVQSGVTNWGSAVSQLPELDHRSIASILGDAELLTPSSTISPSISAFSLRNESTCRQQMSGGRIIVMNSQPDELTQSGVIVTTAADRQRPVTYGNDVMSAASTMIARMENSHRNGIVVDQLFNDSLISDLLTIGGDFLQNLGLGEVDFLHAVNGSPEVFQPRMNQFHAITTSLY